MTTEAQMRAQFEAQPMRGNAFQAGFYDGYRAATEQMKPLVDALRESNVFLQNDLSNERGVVARALLEQQIARNNKALAAIEQSHIVKEA